MRPSLILLPLLFCAAPASAQTGTPATRADTQAIQPPPEFADPATADRLAAAMQSMSRALLDLKVGRLQAALEGRQATSADRNLTVRDLARRNDPAFEKRLQQRIAEARPKMERSLRELNEAMPEVTEDLQRAQRSIERAIANLPDPNYPRR
jgi:DNA-binding PucR family transcriptional regulator